jgi:hypothetical protein
MEGKWVLFGAAASVGMGLLAYVLSEDKYPNRKSPPSLPLSTILDILTSLHKSSTSILISLAGHSLHPNAEGRERGKHYADESRLRTAFEQVYKSFGVTEAEFRRGYELYREDSDVNRLASTLFSNHFNARKGLPPVSSSSTSLSPERVIWLFRTLYHISAGRTLAKLSQLESEGVRLSPFDARFQAAAKKLEREQERLKERLCEQLGLGREGAEGEIRAAVEVFVGDAKFLRLYNEVEEEYRSTMQQIALMRLSAESKSKVTSQMMSALSQIDT